MFRRAPDASTAASSPPAERGAASPPAHCTREEERRERAGNRPPCRGRFIRALFHPSPPPCRGLDGKKGGQTGEASRASFPLLRQLPKEGGSRQGKGKQIGRPAIPWTAPHTLLFLPSQWECWLWAAWAGRCCHTPFFPHSGNGQGEKRERAQAHKQLLWGKYGAGRAVARLSRFFCGGKQGRIWTVCSPLFSLSEQGRLFPSPFTRRKTSPLDACQPTGTPASPLSPRGKTGGKKQGARGDKGREKRGTGHAGGRGEKGMAQARKQLPQRKRKTR